MYRNFGAAQTLSLVAVGALLSSPKQTLHAVHFNAFDAFVNFPAPHALHIRSVVSLYLPVTCVNHHYNHNNNIHNHHKYLQNHQHPIHPILDHQA